MKLCLICFTLSVSLAAHAQTVHVTQYPADVCPDVAAVAARLIGEYPHPSGWRYVVACDETGWGRLIELAAPGQNADDIFGATEPSVRLTILRGTRLVYPRAGEPTPDHTVAHELAHIFLHSSDDTSADRLCKRWMESHGNFDATAGG
jgi:hypothetical protein